MPVTRPQPSLTSTTVALSAKTVVAGVPVVLTATVAAAAGTPLGSATFTDGNATLGMVSLSTEAPR